MNSRTPTPTLQAYIVLSITALCWGANTVFAKLSVGEVSPMVLIMLRWLGVVAIALPLAWRDLRRNWSRLRPSLPYLGAMGALGFTAFNGLFYSAAHNTTALNMGIVQGTIPVFVLLGAVLAYRTRIRPLQAIGVTLTLGGVVLVASDGDWTRLRTLTFNPGDVMIIIACALYAMYTLWLRRKPDISALTWFSLLAVAALAASIPAAAVEHALGAAQWPTPRGWQILLLIVLLPSFIAQVCFIRGVELIGPERSGVFVNLVPVIASLAAVLILGEALRWFHGAALVLVLGGIWLAEHRASALQLAARPATRD